MSIVTIALAVALLVSTAYCLRLYWELRRWARLVNYGRVAVAYKGKVKMQAPLREWALWCRMLDDDKASGGRVVYRMGGTSVAITKAAKPPRRRKTATQPASPPTRKGKWAATDETVKT